MPVRIMCTISFAADDEPGRGGGRPVGFEDHYRRVNKGGYGDGDSRDYRGEEGDKTDGEDEEEEEEVEEEVAELDSLAAFFDGCSLHGANHVFAEDKSFSVRQGLWGIVVTLAISAFIFQVVDRVMYYLQYDHITMLDERVADNMTFPAVTMCNFNTFRRSQLSYSDLIFMGPMLGYEDNMAPGIPLAPEPERAPGSRFSLDEFFNRTRHRIEDILLECEFRGLECGPEHFREVGRGAFRGT